MKIFSSVMAIAVLFILFVSGSAHADESWAIYGFFDKNGDAWKNDVVYDFSQNSEKEAQAKAEKSCHEWAKKKGKQAGEYECRSFGSCQGAGWMAIASSIKSGGKIGISCKNGSEELAISSAKSNCGSQVCAKIYTRKIEEPVKPSEKRKKQSQEGHKKMAKRN